MTRRKQHGERRFQTSNKNRKLIWRRQDPPQEGLPTDGIGQYLFWTLTMGTPITVSAGEAEDNPDRYVTQAGGAQALGKQVTKDDITGALGNLKVATKALDKGTFNRAAVAAVLADPHATATQFAQSEVARHLDPEEQDYVIALLTA